MPFTTSWYVTDRVIYEKFTGFVSFEEIAEVVRLGEEYQEKAGKNALHFIADITELQSLPLNIVQLRNIQLKPPPKKGMTVVVSSPNHRVNHVVTFFAKLMRTIFGLRYKMFPSIEEAYAYLQEVDSTLRDLKPTEATQPATEETITESS